MNAFDHKVAELRAAGIKSKATRKRKQDCTPEEWAAFCEYKKERKSVASAIQSKHYRNTHGKQLVWHEAHRAWVRYALTPQQLVAMRAAREGACAICGQTPDDAKGLHTDHDHDTGFVRGLLCKHCNLGIGWFRDSPELLRKTANYLEAGGDPSFCMVTYAQEMEKKHGTSARHSSREPRGSGPLPKNDCSRANPNVRGDVQSPAGPRNSRNGSEPHGGPV